MAHATTMRSGGRAAWDAGDRILRWSAIFFAAAVLLHNSDHLRRGGDSVSADVFWVGSLSILLEVAVVIVVVQGHRRAPLAALATGFPLALGYVVVHLTPGRSWLSDAFPGNDVSGLSWAAASLEIAAATALGLAGWSALRRRGLAAAASSRSAAGVDPIPLRSALGHPVAVAMIIGNALIFAFTAIGR